MAFYKSLYLFEFVLAILTPPDPRIPYLNVFRNLFHIQSSLEPAHTLHRLLLIPMLSLLYKSIIPIPPLLPKDTPSTASRCASGTPGTLDCSRLCCAHTFCTRKDVRKAQKRWSDRRLRRWCTSQSSHAAALNDVLVVVVVVVVSVLLVVPDDYYAPCVGFLGEC